MFLWLLRWWLLAAPDLPWLGGGREDPGDGDGDLRLWRRAGPGGWGQAQVSRRPVERLHPSVCRWQPGGAVGGFLFSQMTDLQGWRLFFYISLRVSDTYTPWLQEKIPKNFQKCQIVFTLDKQYIWEMYDLLEYK